MLHPLPLKLSAANRCRIIGARQSIKTAFQVLPPSPLCQVYWSNQIKLKRGFRQLLGVSVFGYLNDQRLEMAKPVMRNLITRLLKVRMMPVMNLWLTSAMHLKRSLGLSRLKCENLRGTMDSS